MFVPSFAWDFGVLKTHVGLQNSFAHLIRIVIGESMGIRETGTSGAEA